jgi:leucyl aminopeptidase
VEGAAQGAWHFSELKRPPEEPKPVLARADVLAAEDEWADAELGHREGAAVAAGHLFARGLQVLPPNVCNPAYLAEVAGELARRHGFELTVLDRAAMEQEGLRAILAVGQGSSQEPRFIALRYAGGEGAAPPIVLVGKGITFDSGGLSIKPAQSMEDMKYDMSGAAAVLGTFEMLGRLRPAVGVVGLIPSAENMPGPAAYRPADVVRSHLGKTIEVVNTDAEGRLLLADALSYARRFQPACVVDIATLTGAITICLGPVASGVMGTDPTLVQEVIAAGERANERAWELPLWDDFKELIKSDIADVKNSGGRPAGSITAAWFLREFVEGFPWAHLDIAGTAYVERENAAMVRGRWPASRMRLAWLAVVAAATAACGGGSLIDPDVNQAPFDLAFDDPAGDTVPPVADPPAGLPKAIDLLGVAVAVGRDRITLSLEFAEPVAPWSAGRPNSLDGFVDLDVDEQTNTGVPAAAQAAGRNPQIGADYYVDLRDARPGHVALVNTRVRGFVLVSARFDGATVTIELPRGELDDGDGEFRLSLVVGAPDRPLTDVAPDDLHYVVHRPDAP